MYFFESCSDLKGLFHLYVCDLSSEDNKKYLIILTFAMLNIFMFYTPLQFLSCLPATSQL